MSYLHAISTAIPANAFSQDQFSEFYLAQTADETIQRKARFIGHKSRIDRRHSVLSDLSVLLNAPVQDRLQVYEKEAPGLALQCIERLENWGEYKEKITDLITVSCTGVYAPGLEFDLIDGLGLSNNINRTNITYMGCYAALTALRTAAEITKQANRHVLVVCLELCTLHFQNDFSQDYLYSNYLFADGAAAAIVSSEPSSKALEILDSRSVYAPKTRNDMSWKISERGFLMHLSQDVPTHLEEILSTLRLYPDHQSEELNWAIHPGGIQIVQAAAKAFNIDMDKLQHSTDVLAEFGNMSSPTILFILQRFMQQVEQDKPIVACAFGPGLTIESLLLQHA